jgi:hypothetical protein
LRAIFGLFEQYRSSLLTLAEIERRGWRLAGVEPRNKHLALLTGLLLSEACATRVVYSRKNDRKYLYCVCPNAEREGSAVRPAKSLPAQTIQESVLNRIRAAQAGPFDRAAQVAAIPATVARVGYDGTAGKISIRFYPAAQA